MRTSTFCEVARPSLHFTAPLLPQPNSNTPTFPALSTPSHAVGYSKKDLRNGFKMVGANFNSVTNNGADAGIDLADLKLTGYTLDENRPYIYGDFNLQIMNSTGDGGTVYTWNEWPNDDPSEPAYFPAGWYAEGSDTPIDPNTVKIPVGTGLWVYAEDGIKFGDSGAVDESDRSIDLRNGFKGVANMFAMSIDLSTVTLTGYTLDENRPYIYGDFNAQKLNSTGDGGTVYTWNHWPNDDPAEPDYFPAGWYADGSETPIEEDEASLDAGEGLWVYGEDGVKMNFPAPAIP